MLEIAVPHFTVAEDVYQPHPQHPEHTAPEAAVFRNWRHGPNAPAQLRGHMLGPWPTEIAPGPAAIAHVSAGRWGTDCPFGCGSAQYVSKTDRRFFCTECANAGTGKWVPVLWPGDVELIEAALAKRPIFTTRHWHAPETVADLLGENELRGVA
jgi:hypothetical protein